MEDTFRHKGLRQKLVETIREKGIRDEKVLTAIGKVPRHLFMDSSFVQFAYKDQAFPIDAGQTISQPYTVAFQTALLQVKRHDKVLEVGTGSGYQAAVLLEIGAKVYTIERHRELFLKSRSLLDKMGYKPYSFYGDGYEGNERYSPYDKIIVTAGAPRIPENLLDQLKPGGRMVVPVGSGGGQVMKLVVKDQKNNYKITQHGSFVFVPLLKGKNS